MEFSVATAKVFHLTVIIQKSWKSVRGSCRKARGAESRRAFPQPVITSALRRQKLLVAGLDRPSSAYT
jgi:hypothetical protein